MANLVKQAIGVLAKVPPLQPMLNRVLINKSVGCVPPRPYPYSLWSPVYRPRLMGHRVAAYAARAAVESRSWRTALGGLNAWRSISQVAL